jgi:hypothetical protein
MNGIVSKLNRIRVPSLGDSEKWTERTKREDGRMNVFSEGWTDGPTEKEMGELTDEHEQRGRLTCRQTDRWKDKGTLSEGKGSVRLTLYQLI